MSKKPLYQFLADIYLDRINNYLTIEKFAEHYEIPFDAACALLKAGESCHEMRVNNQTPGDL